MFLITAACKLSQCTSVTHLSAQHRNTKTVSQEHQGSAHDVESGLPISCCLLLGPPEQHKPAVQLQAPAPQSERELEWLRAPGIRSWGYLWDYLWGYLWGTRHPSARPGIAVQ